MATAMEAPVHGQRSELEQQWNHINNLLTLLATSRSFELTQELRQSLALLLGDLDLSYLAAVLRRWAEGRPVPGVSLADLQYFPKPNQLRLSTRFLETGNSAQEAWEFVLAYLRYHGVDGRPRRGKQVSNPRYAQDRTANEYLEGEPIPAPEIPKHIRIAVEHLGHGELKRGLEYVLEHPWFVGFQAECFARKDAHRLADQIETKFRAEYEKAVLSGK